MTIHVREQNYKGWKRQNQNWCLEKPSFPVKNRFSGEKFPKMFKNIKKDLFYTKNSEKYLFFGKKNNFGGARRTLGCCPEIAV